MPDSMQKQHKMTHSRPLVALVLASFLCQVILPAGLAQAQGLPNTVLGLPVPGTMVPVSPGYLPALLKGLTIHPENPLAFNFYVDTGDTALAGQALKDESTTLIKYFLAALTVPDQDLWVNLSPYENDRIIAPGFGLTEMGRDLLAQDYLLKQLASSLMYPEQDLGKKFWDRVYKKAQARYGTTELPFNTFNKVWIVPDQAVVYEHNATAFIVSSRLKVMMEQDYLALDKNTGSERFGLQNMDDQQAKAISELSSSVMKEILIPEIEREVNEGQNFSGLRQIYNAMILATWYKRSLRESLLGKVYVNRNKVKGVDVEDKDIKQKIYDQYLTAFRKGVYSYIKEDLDPVTQQLIPRKYFSGGFDYKKMSNVFELLTKNNMADLEGKDLEAMEDLLVSVKERQKDIYNIGSGLAEGEREAAQRSQTGWTGADVALMSALEKEAKAILVAQRVGRRFGLDSQLRSKVADFLTGGQSEQPLMDSLKEFDEGLDVADILHDARLGMREDIFWNAPEQVAVWDTGRTYSLARGRDDVLNRELRAGHLLRISRDWWFGSGEENEGVMSALLKNARASVFNSLGQKIDVEDALNDLQQAGARSGLFVVEYVDGSANLIFVQDVGALVARQPEVVRESDRLYSGVETMTLRIRSGWKGEMNAGIKNILSQVETAERWRDLDTLRAQRDWLLSIDDSAGNRRMIEQEFERFFVQAGGAEDKAQMATPKDEAKVRLAAYRVGRHFGLDATRRMHLADLLTGDMTAQDVTREFSAAGMAEEEAQKIIKAANAGMKRGDLWPAPRNVASGEYRAQALQRRVRKGYLLRLSRDWLFVGGRQSEDMMRAMLNNATGAIFNADGEPVTAAAIDAERRIGPRSGVFVVEYADLSADLVFVENIDEVARTGREPVVSSDRFYDKAPEPMLATVADRIRTRWGDQRLGTVSANVDQVLTQMEYAEARGDFDQVARQLAFLVTLVSSEAQKDLIRQEQNSLAGIVAADRSVLVSGEDLVPVQQVAGDLRDFIAQRINIIEEQSRSIEAGEADLPEVTEQIRVLVEEMRVELRAEKVALSPLVRALHDTVANGFLETEDGKDLGNEWDIIGALSGISGQLELLSMFGSEETAMIERAINGIKESITRVKGYGLDFLEYAAKTQELELLRHSSPDSFKEGFFNPGPSRADKAGMADNVIPLFDRDVNDEQPSGYFSKGVMTDQEIPFYPDPGKPYVLTLSRPSLQQSFSINILGRGSYFATDVTGEEQAFSEERMDFGPAGESPWVKIRVETDETGPAVIMENLLEPGIAYELTPLENEPIVTDQSMMVRVTEDSPAYQAAWRIIQTFEQVEEILESGAFERLGKERVAGLLRKAATELRADEEALRSAQDVLSVAFYQTLTGTFRVDTRPLTEPFDFEALAGALENISNQLVSGRGSQEAEQLKAFGSKVNRLKGYVSGLLKGVISSDAVRLSEAIDQNRKTVLVVHPEQFSTADIRNVFQEDAKRPGGRALSEVRSDDPDRSAMDDATQDGTPLGGIDLDPTLLDLQIKRDANGVPLPLPQQPVDNMNIEGFYPVIFNIAPAENLPFLLGLSEDEPGPDQVSML